MTGSIEELLGRVKAATGPDRGLDDAILKALSIHSWAGRMSYPDLPMWVDFGSSDITASIDAALALTERVLPGWGIEIGRPAGRGGIGNARLYPGDERNAELTFFGMGETPALAILAATLSALAQVKP